jgi:hypothetical protein
MRSSRIIAGKTLRIRKTTKVRVKKEIPMVEILAPKPKTEQEIVVEKLEKIKISAGKAKTEGMDETNTNISSSDNDLTLKPALGKDLEIQEKSLENAPLLY